MKLIFFILFSIATLAQPSTSILSLFNNDTTPPSLPSSIVATGSENKITLTWTDPTEGDFDSVRIYAGTSANPTTWIASVAKSIQSYKDSNYSYNTIRHYRVKAKDKSNNLSAYSSSVNDTVNMWLGSELILNGTFSSTSNWTIIGANSSISGGTANLVSISAGYTEIYQGSVPCSTAYSYYFSVQVTVNSGQAIVYYQSEAANPLSGTISTSGTYTKVWIPATNSNIMSMKRITSCNVNFDNLSIKRILNP